MYEAVLWFLVAYILLCRFNFTWLTVTRHVFINIFQTEHFSAVKSILEVRKIWASFWYQKLWKFEKNWKKKIGWAPLRCIWLDHITYDDNFYSKFQLVSTFPYVVNLVPRIGFFSVVWDGGGGEGLQKNLYGDAQRRLSNFDHLYTSRSLIL